MTSAQPFPPNFVNTLLCDFLDPAVTMADLARRHDLSLIQLVRFFQSPEISSILKEIVSAIKDRAELLAAAGLHAIVRSQRLTIDECNDIAEADPIKPEHLDDPKALATRTRFRDQARKSANILLRLAKPATSRMSAADPALTTPAQADNPTPPTPIPRAA